MASRFASKGDANVTPSERYTAREDIAHLYEQRLAREARFREPSDAEIDTELKRREDEKQEATDGDAET